MLAPMEEEMDREDVKQRKRKFITAADTVQDATIFGVPTSLAALGVSRTTPTQPGIGMRHSSRLYYDDKES
jgi:hypothetical protein